MSQAAFTQGLRAAFGGTLGTPALKERCLLEGVATLPTRA